MAETVIIREVGLREGVQSLPVRLTLEQKLELISLLNETGVQEIELTALVRPDRVPAMADADALISVYPVKKGVSYTALYLNEKGFLRGEASARLQNKAWLYAAASETFFKKNYNHSLESFIATLPGWKKTFDVAEKPLYGVMISCAFGCAYEGALTTEAVFSTINTILVALQAAGMSPVELSLADTVGLAHPGSVTALLKRIQATFPGLTLSLHLHDTRGLGLANVAAGLAAGVRIFEGSLGGIGGCPFAPGATGNVATEEVVYLCETEGLKTGINLDAYIKVLERLEAFLGRDQIPGKLYRAGRGQHVVG